jgi:hypothetical protein
MHGSDVFVAAMATPLFTDLTASRGSGRGLLIGVIGDCSTVLCVLFFMSFRSLFSFIALLHFAFHFTLFPAFFSLSFRFLFAFFSLSYHFLITFFSLPFLSNKIQKKDSGFWDGEEPVCANVELIKWLDTVKPRPIILPTLNYC